MSETELVRCLQRGDESAFRLVVDRYGDDLFRVARALLGSEADAQDVVQETFLGAFRRIGSFEGRSSLKTWLMRILFNLSYKARRSRRVRRALTIDTSGSEGEYDDASLREAPSDAAVAARLDVNQMLGSLSEEHSQVLVLRELQRMTYDEIATVLGVPVGTVESRLFRARRELKRRFEGYLTS